MSLFAPVVPLPIARQLKQEGHLGNYHLLLAHDILAEPTGYKEVYGHLWDDPHAAIILDNSVIELGKAMDVDDLIRAAEIIRPKYIVIPDVMGDAGQTVMAAQAFVSDYKNALWGAPFEFKTPLLMGVVHGQTFKECRWCADDLRQMDCVGALSAPRILTGILGSRMETVLYLRRFQDFDIHLLGFSDDILDDVCCARISGVMGIDSAVPIRAAMQGIQMALENFDCGPRGSFWKCGPADKEQLEHIIWNIVQYRKWIGNGVSPVRTD